MTGIVFVLQAAAMICCNESMHGCRAMSIFIVAYSIFFISMYNLAFLDFPKEKVATAVRANHRNHTKAIRIGTKKTDILMNECSHIAYYWEYLNYDSSHCFDKNIFIDFRNIELHKPINIIHIGINKGLNIAMWMNMWAPHSGVNSEIWWNVSRQYFNVSDCGVCYDCQFQISRFSKQIPNRHVTVIGVDLNNENIKFVDNVIKQIKQNSSTQSFQNVTVRTILAVVSDSNGEAWVEKCIIGDEHCRVISQRDASKKGKNEMYRIPQIRVDDLVKDLEHHGALKLSTNYNYISTSTSSNKVILGIKKNSSTNSSPRYRAMIDILQITMKGQEASILEGAIGTLLSGQVRMLIMDYHNTCPIPKMVFESMIHRFNREVKYDCYFIGQMRLWKITGCWHPLWEARIRSNIMCLLRGDSWHTLAEKNYRVTLKWVSMHMQENNITIRNLTAQMPITMPNGNNCE